MNYFIIEMQVLKEIIFDVSAIPDQRKRSSMQAVEGSTVITNRTTNQSCNIYMKAKQLR